MMDASSSMFSPALGSNTPSSSINGENSNDRLPVWVETKTKDNKVYYYSSTTKETTWKRPENVRIVKYEDLMKKSLSSPGQQQKQNLSNVSKGNSADVASSFEAHDSNNLANPVNTATLMQNNSPNMSLPQTFQPFGLPPPTMFNNRPPMTLPPLSIGPPAVMAAAMAATMRYPPISMAAGAALPMAGIPGASSMLAMAPFMPPGWRPNGSNVPLVNRPMISETDIQRRIYLTQVSADLRDRALEWQEYKSPDNRNYFLNIKTSERTTEKPAVIQELDDAIAVIKEQKAKKAIEEARAQEGSPVQQQQQQQQQQQGEVNKVVDDNDEKRSDDNSKKSPHTSQSDSQTKGTTGKQKEGMKPVSTTAVPGTPWCVVWTDKNRVFYFNPSTKTSVWERPAELRNREDVDKMVSNPILPTNSQNDDDSRQSASSDQCSAQAEKRIKLDASAAGSVSDQSAPSKPTSVVPKIMKKEVASEIEKEAAKKRELISFEERVDTFKKLLEEKEVNPSSTFQKELSKIVFDPRYLLLTSVERREVFEKWCTEKKESEHQKRRDRIKKATKDFNKLLEDANLTSHSRYDDFHDQYSKDPRYTALERTKDREILFDDHLAMLRRRERHERTHRSRERHHHSDRRKSERDSHNLLRKKRAIAEDNFRQLLRETKLIDGDTRRKIEESEHQHLIDIIETLQNDKRYLDLEPFGEERRKILLSYIEELASTSSSAGGVESQPHCAPSSC